MKRIIRRILKEEYELTETEYMGNIIPYDLVNELGIKLHNEGDVASISEIQFDTKRIVIELFTYDEYGDYVNYEDSRLIPDGFKYIYLFYINDLPINFIKFLLKELNDKYSDSYLLPFLDILPKGLFKNF
jgi:hypothetical protein